MFKIPFYQDEWNSIDLTGIAREVGLSANTLPTREFYARYYSKVNAQKSVISDEWRAGKQAQSAWLEEQLTRYGDRASRIISIGAGLGLIELPLIEKGYRIDLHDFQADSFAFMNMTEKTRCFCGSWDELPAETYDMCYTMATSYAFDDATFKDFARMARRILKPGGICFIMDASISWRETYVVMRNFRRFPRTHVLWGYKRSFGLWRKAFEGFDVLDKRYYERGMREAAPKEFLGVPYGMVPHRQCMVFRKRA